MRGIIITLGLLLAAGRPSLGQDWATRMFDHTSHDFGIVARGQETVHRFPLENIYVEDVCIESVHSSCHCITPKVDRNRKRLKTHQKGAILALVDTRKFLGRKEATFRINVSCQTSHGLLRAEVQLHVYAYIRSDVVLEPGTVQFGSVTFGAGAPAKRVSISYAGRSDWKILRAESGNPHLNLRLVETGRNPGRGSTQVSYDLFVGLSSDAPVGYVRDPVLLVTNDRDKKATRIVIDVEGSVVPTISAQPSPLMLGVINPGQQVERTLVVRGKEPFRITKISSPDDRFRLETSDEAKTLHVVPVKFTAGDAPGPVTGEIHIQTDSPGAETLVVKCHGQIVAPHAEKSSE
jgi:hypothetical protein